jgi:hypothetical protein
VQCVHGVTVTDNETGRGGLKHAFDGQIMRVMLETNNELAFGLCASPFLGRYGRGMHQAALSAR